MADNVVFLEPGDERAQKIAKAMGSQTASDILQILGEGPRSLTDITDHLNIPMNTAKYHVENLLDAGLIAVEKTKYSIKGREVKIYTLTNQLLVVAPRQSNARSLFMKYAALFAVLLLATVMISAFSPLFAAGMFRGSAQMVNTAPSYSVQHEEIATAKATGAGAADNFTPAPGTTLASTRMVTDSGSNVSAAMVPEPTPTISPPVPEGTIPPAESFPGLAGFDPAFAFFLGGALVILVLLIYEAGIWRRLYR